MTKCSVSLDSDSGCTVVQFYRPDKTRVAKAESFPAAWGGGVVSRGLVQTERVLRSPQVFDSVVCVFGGKEFRD